MLTVFKCKSDNSVAPLNCREERKKENLIIIVITAGDNNNKYFKHFTEHVKNLHSNSNYPSS